MHHTFRPRTGLFACGLWALLGVVWLVFAAKGGVGQFFTELPFVVFFSTIVYGTCGRPVVLVSDDDVLLRNVVRDVRIPWPALDGIATQYALALTTKDGKKYNAWAAPASGRFSAAKVSQADLRALKWRESDGPLPSSATLRSDSGSAAAIVKLSWNRAKERLGATTDEGRTSAEISWAVPTLTVMAISGAASVISLVNAVG